MTLIEHYEVPSGGVSSIVFDDIPQTFTDLLIKISARSDRASTGEGGTLLFPSGTYLSRVLRGDGSGTASFDQTFGFAFDVTATSRTANTFSSAQIYIPNYTSSAEKTASCEWVQENNATQSLLGLVAYKATYSSAITELTIGLSEGTTNKYVEFSTFTLYGITAGSDGIVAVS
jgi:hypothetical protein